ncbi:hypothetical protein V6N11_021878 [Hibiscus sabdariffa]|uniref:Uncharacterized protein n=1 Tax=Hibiscus sabdariffa TaxID=183260 RepID=A0ABR2THJ1_9ROSI
MVEDTVVMKALAEKTMVVEVSLLSCIHVLVVFLVLLILFVTLPVSSMKVLASFFLYSLHRISLSLHHADISPSQETKAIESFTNPSSLIPTYYNYNENPQNLMASDPYPNHNQKSSMYHVPFESTTSVLGLG